MNKLEITPYESPVEEVNIAYQILGIRRINWCDIWNRMTERQRMDACGMASLSSLLAYDTWNDMRYYDQDRIRAALRRAWAEGGRKH